jgi:tetratricopeptide (TPR) repeat protein
VPPAISDAAAWLLPNDGAQLVVTFSERWQSAAAEEWSKKHAEIQSNLQRLAELDAAAGDGPLNDAEALERGFLAERFIDTEAALLRFEQALGWGGNNAAVLFQIGRILLDLGRDEGLLCLKQVIDQDDDSIVPACELAESYLAEAGRSGEAADFVRRRSAQMEILNADRADRSQIDRADKLTPHGWDDEQLEDIMRAIGIARKKGLRRAWMVQKETRHRAWEAAYFLVCDFGSYRRSDEELELLLTEMSGYLKNCGNICILLCDPNERWLPTKVSMVNNSKLFPN